MANYGLLGGLGDALSGFGKIGLKEWSDSQDEERDARKMQLKNKLDMDLMKAKYQFMKENPRYKQFFTDLSGNRIGVDEQGNERMVHQATADEAADAKGKREADINYRKALAGAADARAANAGATTGSTNARNEAEAALARARIGHLGDPKGADKSILAPKDWDTAVEAEVKRSLGKQDYENPDDGQLAEAREKAAAKLRGQGYTRGFQRKGGATGLGAFSGAPGLGGAGGGLLTIEEPVSVGGEDTSFDDHGPDDDEDDVDAY